MRLTKDEARILSEALRIAKYEMVTLSHNVFDKLEALEEKLSEHGKDQRRTGRMSQDDFNDCLRRFVKK